ncbi:MAG: RNA polymerase sigma-70 factor [Mangrovibacterium sp.]
MSSYKRKNFIQQLKSGEETIFDSLYRCFFPKLEYFSNQYILDQEASKNIVQDVFTELWDKKDTFRDDTNIQAWLFTVTKNKSLKYIARQKSQKNYSEHIRHRELEINHRALNEVDTSNFMLDELKSQIENALNKLSPACRKVFEMSRFEGMKQQQIADKLGLSVKTVETHISKALRVFKTELKDYLPLFCLYFLFYPENF